MKRTTYRVDLAYDGSSYAGFAKQLDQRTVEGEILKVLQPHIKDLPAIMVGGRTDKGVNATGQVISFWSHTEYPTGFIDDAFRALPDDIATQNVRIVPRSFHARYSASGRRYVYFAPLLDVSIHRMNLMFNNIIGRRCFSAFARNTPPSKSTIRTLWEARVRITNFEGRPALRFNFGADGFLRKQIRVLVATVIREAIDAKDEYCLLDYCEQADRRLTAKPASPEGLYLSKIIYGPC